MKKLRISLPLAGISLLAAISPANGQTSTPSDAMVADKAASAPSDIADIVVTAQRRSERLQDVPIAVIALGNDALKQAGVTNPLELGRMVPSVNINSATGTFTPFIRGIGNPLATAGNEASAATYVDGVYISRVYADFLPLENVERVEVLKGPQGTLFGRNSTAGLINIITRTPSTTRMEGSVGYGNYDTIRSTLYASTPLWNGAAMDFSGAYLNQNDGWGRNVTTGEDIAKQRRYNVRSKFVDQLTDTTRLTLSAGYAHSRNNFSTVGNAVEGTTQGNQPGNPVAIYLPVSFYDVRGNKTAQTRARSFDAMIRLDQDLTFAQFVSLSGYRKSKIDADYDIDYTPLNTSNVNLLDREKQYSQEFQLLSPTQSKITWIVGVYYLHARSAYDPSAFSGTRFGVNDRRTYGAQTINSYSGYAQASVEILPRTKITLGGRYTSDDVSILGRVDSTAPGGAPVLVRGADLVGSTNFSKFTYRAAIDHKLNTDVLLYASVSRGFKSGVYPTNPAANVPVKPEVVDAYEIGFKSILFDRHVRFNGSIFQNDISNPQVAIRTSLGSVIVNAGGARTRGAELEAQIVVDPRFQIMIAGTYLDAKYTNFTGAPFTGPNTALVNGILPGCTTPATSNLNTANGGNVNFCNGNASGNRLPRAPNFTANLGFNYSIPMSRGELRVSPNLSYNGGFYWDADNRTRQRAYMLFDGTISYVTSGDHLTIRLWGKNLTGRKYYGVVAETGDPGGNPSTPAAPRTYGVAADFSF